MPQPSGIRAAAIVALAVALVGCSAEPSTTYPVTASTTPTAPAPTAPENPPRLSAIHLPDLFQPPADAPITYGPIRAIPDGGFIVTGTVGLDTPVIWYGDTSGESWVGYDASDMGGEIADLAAGPAGWIAATRTGQQGFRLWVSKDGLAWVRYPEPAGLDRAFTVSVGVRGETFSVSSDADANGANASWRSTDGMHWTAGVSAVAPTEGIYASLGSGFVAVAPAYSDQPPSVSLSADGRSWTPIQSRGDVLPVGVWRLEEAGGGVIALGSVGSDGPTRAWYGALSGSGSDTAITWSETTPGGGFGARDFAAEAYGGQLDTLLSFRPTSHEPITWTTSGSAPWSRHELPSATFGGGIPSGMAVVGTTVVALGWRVNPVGEYVLRPWRSVDAGPWSEVEADVFGSLPTAPSGPCPPVALHEVGSYLAIPSLLRPTCFGHQTLRIRGYAADCGGCGGVDPSIRQPAWLQHALHIWDLYLQSGPPTEPPPNDRLGISIDPARPIRIPPIGAYVEITGHFDDPAAMTCTEEPVGGGGIEPRSILIATCRQEFVATSLTVLAR